MGIYERVKALCDNQNLAVTALEKKLGFGRGTIGKWRHAAPSSKSLTAVADYFNISVTWLLNGASEDGEEWIPLYEYVSAGYGAVMNAVSVGYIDLKPPKDGYEYFALKVRGNSMAPRISDGDVVIVRKQNDVKSGEIAIASINGDEATCKQIIKSESGIAFVGLNTDVYSPTFFTNEEIEKLPITILGKVIRVVAEL